MGVTGVRLVKHVRRQPGISDRQRPANPSCHPEPNDGRLPECWYGRFPVNLLRHRNRAGTVIR